MERYACSRILRDEIFPIFSRTCTSLSSGSVSEARCARRTLLLKPSLPFRSLVEQLRCVVPGPALALGITSCRLFQPVGDLNASPISISASLTILMNSRKTPCICIVSLSMLLRRPLSIYHTTGLPVRNSAICAVSVTRCRTNS